MSSRGAAAYPYGSRRPIGPAAPVPAVPAVPDWTGWESYHGQMFGLAKPANNWIAWKINSTGVNIARKLVAARNADRQRHVTAHGDEDTWPLPHSPAVLWMPYYAHAACLGCFWMTDATGGEIPSAAIAARSHARQGPPGSPAAERWVAGPITVLMVSDGYPPPTQEA